MFKKSLNGYKLQFQRFLYLGDKKRNSLDDSPKELNANPVLEFTHQANRFIKINFRTSLGIVHVSEIKKARTRAHWSFKINHGKSLEIARNL